MDAPVHVSRHPLVLHKLAVLRDRATDTQRFREMVRDLSRLLFYEAAQDLKLAPCQVNTPLATCEGQRIGDRIGLVPVLRAGLGMADVILDLVPDAQVWHLGLYRDHKTLQPVTYYNKLSATPQVDICFVVDPMLATGGSALAAVETLKRWGVNRLKVLSLIAAPEGVRAVQEAHPDVPIFLGALDSHLNEVGYIVPGLGDAGDRQFGT